MNIDYRLLSEAVAWYSGQGLTQIEVPWIVPSSATLATFQNRCGTFTTQKGDLIGSAEQGFINLLDSGSLKTGSYMAISPCFRNERVVDSLHQYWFVKLELAVICYGASEREKTRILGTMVNQAQLFFASRNLETYVLGTPPNQGSTIACFDLLSTEHGHEVGSYGVRELENGFTIIYGTGLALPRFSYVRSLGPGPNS